MTSNGLDMWAVHRCYSGASDLLFRPLDPTPSQQEPEHELTSGLTLGLSHQVHDSIEVVLPRVTLSPETVATFRATFMRDPQLSWEE